MTADDRAAWIELHRRSASCAGRCWWSAGSTGVGWDEFVSVVAAGDGAPRAGPGGRPRPGGGPGARGHRGHGPHGTRVAVQRRARCGSRWATAGSAASATAAGSRSTAARRCSAELQAAVAGDPLNPVRREPPAEPVLTGVSVHRRPDHPGPRPEAAGVLRRRACRTSSWPPRSPRRPPPAASRSAWSSPAWA